MKGNAFTGRACERGKAFDGPAGHESLVAAVQLGHRLLNQGNPQLTSFGLKIKKKLYRPKLEISTRHLKSQKDKRIDLPKQNNEKALTQILLLVCDHQLKPENR